MMYASVLNNDNMLMYQANINTLFLATRAEPILVYVRKTKWQKAQLTVCIGPFRNNLYISFIAIYDVGNTTFISPYKGILFP